MKNAGKACNNRLYRHIRTFEKIVKNYFVISTYIIGNNCNSINSRITSTTCNNIRYIKMLWVFF